MLKSREEAFQKFLHFKAMVEKQSGEKLKKLRSENGGEYKSENFQNYCKNEGILQEFTAAYSPNQNGVAERLNRTILDKARSMHS